MLQNNIDISPSILFSRKNQNSIRINCSFEMSEKFINALDLLIMQISDSQGIS
jgi:hypothetical protein